MWKTKILQAEEDGGVVTAGGTPEMDLAAPAAETADDSTESDVNWGEVNDDFDALDVEGEHEIIADAPAETPTKVETPAVAPVETPVTPPATPAETPPPSQELPTPTPAPQASPEEYQTWKAGKLTQLEQEYAIAEADATALLTEPELVLPKLAARVHMEVLESSMRAMQAMMPVMMQQVTQHTELNTKAKNLFTSVNPDLADPRYEPAIMQLGRVYRNVNKSAPPDEAARAIGALVRSALGIAAPQAVAPQAVAPAPQAPVPFTPARGGGGGNAPAAPSNPFEALAMEMQNEDW
jgi:hypothetical protein